MKTSAYNAHSFKLLLQAVQLKFNNLGFKTEKDFIELAHLITKQERGLDTYDDDEFSIKVVTLRRYWGFHKYGSKYRRYTPDELLLDVLARSCGFKNWIKFEQSVKNQPVTNILPYERKLHYLNTRIWFRNQSKVGDIIYLGDENKYIAVEQTIYGLELFDFKNVPFATFTWLEVEGIEVIAQKNQEIKIRLIY